MTFVTCTTGLCLVSFLFCFRFEHTHNRHQEQIILKAGKQAGIWLRSFPVVSEYNGKGVKGKEMDRVEKVDDDH
jgi:hypothetical protein